ncbi:DUF5990 family protein [Sphaerisporangium corydalis]|uniref:DUF5990 family protein n=1 Tax=Sphaerisporangium corydalis TaxID=1441875 RepID=A0ABV9EKV2_9ACTN|nr:DUF5990 family protein [Sphaerisporangium corydalis]
MRIRIEGFDLPGRTWDTHQNGGVHVGVQKRGRPEEILEPQAGDAPSAVWTLECGATPGPDGVDITGPYVQGRPGGRFVYLSWGIVGDEGGFEMFRRAKLMLDALTPDVVEAAMRSGVLLARLGLTDAKGLPVCAAVRPPAVTWSAVPA